MKYEIHIKENLYFYLKIFFTILFWIWVIRLIYFWYALAERAEPNILKVAILGPVIFYGVLIFFVLIARLGLMIGMIKGNAVKISDKQLPEINDTINRQCLLLEIVKPPDVYLLQSGGVLNAFATRFMGSNYLIIYNEILEESYHKNKEAVDFILGHELGHIKRKHMLKRLWTLPSALIPFLEWAYSRACEYTCDNIGAALSPQGARNGLIMLAAGKKLYDKINMKVYIDQKDTEAGFWFWLAEKMSTHPHLTRRLAMFQHSEYEPKSFVGSAVQLEEKTSDHSKYMPG